MGWVVPTIAILILVALLGLVAAVAVALYRRRGKRYDPPVEHLAPARQPTWQSRHREAYDRHRRIPSRHQPEQGGPPARLAQARMSKRSPRK